MTSDGLHDRLEALFHEADGLSPPALAEFLGRVRAKDARLADELEGLLSAESHSDAWVARLGRAVPRLDERTDAASEPGTLTGRRLAHYRVRRLLGVGGMGEVYLATDVALGRPAALKVLKPTRAEAAPYFRREIATTARLQHPAIATFYEVREVGDILFLAMEYVPGRTLRAWLKEGPLEPRHAVSIAMTLLEAVSHAHTVGVVHRDIKPENVILTEDGAPKLMDFGIAKALEPIGTEGPRTGTGQILGTLGYMAPEQLGGDFIDHRADLFAIAAVLYELLAGRPAFPGATALQRMVAISAHKPAPLDVEQYGPALDAILVRGLSKDPAKRYSSAGAMIEELRALTTETARRRTAPTVAVMDFTPDLTAAEEAWLGHGLAQGLSSALSARPGVEVVPDHALRGRMVALANEDAMDAGALGRALACTWVITGDYGRAGDELRITMRIVDAITGGDRLSETFSGPVGSVFELQRRITDLTVEVIETGLDGGVRAGPDPDLAAYELVARSRAPLRAGGKGDHRRAREYLEEAIRIDPEYADAHAALAQTAAMEFIYNARKETLEEAVRHAKRALELKPDHTPALTWLLYARHRQGRPAEATRLADRLIRIAPTDHNGPYFRGAIELAAGQPNQALPYLQNAVELEDRHGLTWAALGWAHLERGDPASAEWCLRMAHDLELDADANFRTGGAGALLAECLRRDGDLDQAARVAREALERAERSDFVYRDTFRALALCSLGRTALDREDREGAGVAFRQAEQHLRGRPAALGGGFVLVQAIAGAVRAGGEPAARLDDALHLLQSRGAFNFETMWGASEAVALLELARACAAVGRRDQSARLLQRAVRTGSGEARSLEMP